MNQLDLLPFAGLIIILIVVVAYTILEQWWRKKGKGTRGDSIFDTNN